MAQKIAALKKEVVALANKKMVLKKQNTRLTAQASNMKEELDFRGFVLHRERQVTSRFAQGCLELRAHEDCPPSFRAALDVGLELARIQQFWNAEAFATYLAHVRDVELRELDRFCGTEEMRMRSKRRCRINREADQG